jgi:hypothetical protein
LEAAKERNRLKKENQNEQEIIPSFVTEEKLKEEMEIDKEEYDTTFII